jgi:hypothetical protein
VRLKVTDRDHAVYYRPMAPRRLVGRLVLLFGAALALLPAAGARAAGNGSDPAAAIPAAAALAPLVREGEVDRRSPETLWERIDGQAELYRSSGLLGSAHARFTDPGDERRSVELSVFALGEPLAAFGLFAYFRPAGCAAAPFGNGGCYGDYQAFFWLGATFVLAEAAGPEAARALDLRRALAAAAARLGPVPPLPAPLERFSRVVPEACIRYQPRHLFGRAGLPPGLEGRVERVECFLALGPASAAETLSRYRTTLEGAKLELRDGDQVLSGRDPVLGPVTLLARQDTLVGARSAPDAPGLLPFLRSLVPREQGAPP